MIPKPLLQAARLLVGTGLLMIAGAAWGGTLPVTRFTSREGLAGERVKRIVADPSGFLWFCTASGLSRYDGNAFTSYRVADGLPDPSVNDLLVSADGSYWVATNGGGVAELRPHASTGPLFVPLSIHDEAPRSRRVNVLLEGAGERMWAGTDGGLFSWRPGQGERTLRRETLTGDLEADRRLQVFGLAEDRHGTLWVGTSGGLYAVGAGDGPGDRHLHRPALGRPVLALLLDHEGRLWVGHRDGLLVVVPRADGRIGGPASLPVAAAPCAPDPETAPSLPRDAGAACRWRPQGPDSLAAVHGLHEDRRGRVWVASSAVLVAFEEGRAVSSFDSLPFPPQRVIAVAEDAGENLWLGTDYAGAARIVLDGFVTFGETDGLRNPTVVRVFGGPAGEVYVVSLGGLVHRVDGERLVAVEANLPQQAPGGGRVETHHAVQDRHGDWWFPTAHGLFRFPAVSDLEELAGRRPLGPYTARDGLHGDDTRNVFPDSSGDLWITTRLPGREVLSRWERDTGTFHRYSAPDGLEPYNPPASFLEEPPGTRWFGLGEGGLLRYRDGGFERFGAREGVPRGAVQALLADGDGGLWVGGLGGLARAGDPGALRPRFEPVVRAGRLPQVTSLVADLQGRVYVGTAGGLFRLDPGTERLERFTVAEGLTSDWVRTAYRDAVGDLWFGTSSGLSRLSPRPPRSRPPPVPRIERLTVDGVRWPLPELGTAAAGPFALPRRPARVRIDFAALGLHPGEILRYRYRLEGADPGWGPAGEHRSVLLGNLGPGRYRFMVEAIDRQGAASPEPATLAFTVPAPFWRQGWFLALATAILAAALAGAHRLRVRRLVELERMRNRIAADLHDELGASLTRISILSEVAHRRSGGAGGEILSEIGETARSLLESTRDLVWAIDPRHEEAAELAVRLRSFASDLLEGRGVAWELVTAGPLAEMRLSPEHRRHLLLFFKEALHNVVRHAGAGRVELSLAVAGGALRAAVEDDGRGMDAAALAGEGGEAEGRGLLNLRHRAAALGGRVEIDSAPGAGTRVRLDVPLR